MSGGILTSCFVCLQTDAAVQGDDLTARVDFLSDSVLDLGVQVGTHRRKAHGTEGVYEDPEVHGGGKHSAFARIGALEKRLAVTAKLGASAKVGPPLTATCRLTKT